MGGMGGGIKKTDILSDGVAFAGARINNMLVDVAPVLGTLATDGTEQTLVEIDLSASPKVCVVTGYIDTTNQTATETIQVKRYIQIKVAGGYVLDAVSDYAGVQFPLLLKIEPAEFSIKLKLTVKKTAGTNRSYDYQILRKVQA